jgi:putative alpha-1,2-mannosidase
LEPKRVNDFVQTFLNQYNESGLLPVWELAANETDCMIGNHSIPVIADAWAKGIRGYDGKLALEAMMKNANSDRYGLRWYREMGFVPSDREAESVSKTLEYAYDDWCISQTAKSMGQTTLLMILPAGRSRTKTCLTHKAAFSAPVEEPLGMLLLILSR